MNRREFLSGGAARTACTGLAADEKTTDGGFADVSWAKRLPADVPVLPPGAHGVSVFRAKCVGCGLCVAACPSHCLRLSGDARHFGKPVLDFRYGWCRPGCLKCGAVCPAGAIEPVGYTGKRLIHVGQAVWRQDLCLRTTEGVDCHACEKHCPAQAVRLIANVPVVDRAACLGCGACEHYCPTRPETAIRVQGFERHREVRPIAEPDLLLEMRAQLDAGKACVVAQGGVIVASETGRGVKPALTLLDAKPGLLRESIVADRIVGRAAAAIWIAGGVRKICAPVMSEGAVKLCARHGVAVDTCKTVPAIVNRAGTGTCPMDARIEKLDDIAAMVAALRAAQK